MRIADLLMTHAVPGAFIVDRTAESAGLSGYAALAPEFGLPLQRGGTTPGEDAPLALVLHSLAPSGSDDPTTIDIGELAGLASSVIHIVFFDRVEAFLEHGLIDLATRDGYELASTHHTEHKVFRLAAVFRKPEVEASSARLRLISEYRFDKLLVRVLEREQARLTRERDDARARLAELGASLQLLRSDRKLLGDTYEQERAAHHRLRVEYKLMEADGERMRRSLDRARGDSDDLSQRLKTFEERLALTFQTLERSRRSVSFRLGLATWSALTRSGKNVFRMPGRWLRTFRGPDRVVEKLRDVPKLARPAPAAGESRVEIAGVAKQMLLLGLEPSEPSFPGVAGVVSRRFADELTASTRFRALAPHNWRHLLEADPAAYVLVTADGLQAGAPWGSWGTPGGRDWLAMLREMVAWCRSMQLPIVYWDTIGSGPILSGLGFNRTFTVSRRSARELVVGADVLLPAIEPTMWNPLAVAPAAPSHPVYVGDFDRRRDPVELAALEAVLRAAASRGLEIFDSHAGVQGRLADTFRFPSGLGSLTRRRPLAEAERLAIKRAGLVLCGNLSPGSDFPSWDVLRGLAMGAHVVSTPAATDDDLLAEAIESAGDAARAEQALDRLAQRPLLDATWRQAFDHLLARYSLRDRLDQIARACGASAVSAPRPSIAVVAQLKSEAEARALRGFLGAQTVAPDEVRVLVEAEVDVDGHVNGAVGLARVVRLRAGDPQAANALGDSDATHLLCWSAGTPAIPEAIAELAHAAMVARDDVLALAPEGDTPADWLYGHGGLPPDAVVAVRRAAVLGHLRSGLPPEHAAARLAAEGSGCLIKVHRSAGVPDSRRSIA